MECSVDKMRQMWKGGGEVGQGEQGRWSVDNVSRE